MYENHHFLRETIVDVNAAVVGISRNRWVGIEANKTEAAAKQIMREKRFDILPVKSESNIKNYFTTIERNKYDDIKKMEITHRDVIPLQTHIRDVIKGFYCEKRFFYFLLDDNKISGFVSESNLNSRQVKVWLFSLLCELEIRLGELVTEHFQNEELQQKVIDHDPSKSKETIRRFRKDLENGIEANFVEYLYLLTLINIIRGENLYSNLGYNDKDKFKKDYDRINDLRNKVMHPKSVITKEKSVNTLWLTIDKIEESLFLLR